MPLPPEIELHLSRELAKCKQPRTDAEIIKIIEDVLMDLTIDHSHWEEAQEFRKDLAWLRDTRARCESMKTKGLITIVSVIVAGILSLVAFGFKEFIEHG
jgi:hypothetical protein